MSLRPWLSTKKAAVEAAAVVLLIILATGAVFIANLASDGREAARLVSNAMLAGNSIWGSKFERPVIETYIDAMPKPDVVVLGSSRMLPIDSASFPGLRLVNLAVSNASIEDTAVTYNLLAEAGKLPQLVLVTCNCPGRRRQERA